MFEKKGHYFVKLSWNLMIFFNPKGGGGGEVQNDPMGFRLAAISHRIMQWSQKFLTLSIYILSRR